MPDPIHDLENLKHEGLTVNPLPASEVRRRGTRMRRRNNMLVAAGTAAVLAVVATPFAVMAGGSDDAAPGPVDTPSNPTVTWKQAIPGDFDLAALPDDATFRFTTRDASVVDDVTLCGRPTFSTASNDPVGPAVDTAGASYGEPGTDGSAARTLALYEDDKVAAKAVEGFRAGVSYCPEETQGRGAPLVYDAVDTELPADDSFVFTQQARMDKDLLADLTVIQVARVGNAVYLATDHTSAGGPQVVDGEVRRLAAWSAPVLSDMCVFAAEPCDAGSVPDGSPAPGIGEGAVSTIPDDFPLAQDLVAPEGDPLDGPSADARGVEALDLCGSEVWPPEHQVERRAVTATGPEYRESRELVTFSRLADATTAVARIRDAVQDCMVVPADATVGGDPAVVALQPVDDADLGDADESVTFSVTPREGLGGGIYQFARLGRAVYGTYEAGEWSPDTVPAGVSELSGHTAAIVTKMCPWTETGC